MKSLRLDLIKMESRIVLGKHLIAELWVRSSHVLDDADYVRESLLTACRKGGFSVIGIDIREFSPRGVTGIVLLSESHVSIHTWPEYHFAAVDIFSCAGAGWEALEELKRKLDVERMEVRELDRGVMEPAQLKTVDSSGYRAMELP